MDGPASGKRYSGTDSSLEVGEQAAELRLLLALVRLLLAWGSGLKLE